MQETLVWFLSWEDLLEKGWIPTPVFLDFPSGSDGKESTCNAGDLGSIPGLGRFPGGGQGNPLQYPCLENPPGQRRLQATYSPWGHKELDTTERLSTAQSENVINLPRGKGDGFPEQLSSSSPVYFSSYWFFITLTVNFHHTRIYIYVNSSSSPSQWELFIHKHKPYSWFLFLYW